MSLDVYLTLDESRFVPAGSGIFIRDKGQTVEISREEWNARYPDQQIAAVDSPEGEYVETDRVFHRNITHNLGRMAEAAGIYQCLWRPDEIGITKAEQLIEPLRDGLKKLRSNPDLYTKFNPSNGWGSYDVLVDFVVHYWAACCRYPTANVSVSR